MVNMLADTSTFWSTPMGGGIIGFVVGFSANWAFAKYYAWQSTRSLRNKFESIAGQYDAFLFLESAQNPARDIVDFSKSVGRCRIAYEHHNVLTLTYSETDAANTWEALIWMETPFVGSMTWRYVQLNGVSPPHEHRFGFKRCVVSEARDNNGALRKFFYLVGDPPFENEALRKIESA